ncbi:alkyl hydroperoxide reductase [Edaphobacter acidisoli]|uniref:thioredoxin-dependent peroxiredoxin n=1 Tax=Edaphobacter acidisoli TaxID=2040573 RepID=A0A916RI03_9BACT|nr:peroxiredoxin-like family protein [Edaphobacter acidisoli]GGA57380.1 alkyl hydroperoxide reductase [Edaphobacter acidisoli]
MQSLPTLQERLDQITQNTRRLVQPERLAITEQAAADLFHTGIEDRILRTGAQVPAFTLEDARTGRPISSADLLSVGPLIVNFFRGRWCPYCVTELETWRDLYPEVRKRGALLVAISPQTTRQNNFAIEQHGLPFPLVADPGAKVAEAFGLAYTVPEEQRRYFQSILVNIPFNNAGLNYRNATEESWRLPLPGVFVIAQDGKILFSEAHADFRVRPEPADVLAVLDKR